ncbi:DUF6470 family protein [Cohnella terricola]|uniref:YviE n=1 Tax=Cohnella terricola TaxID=1289167 RepID=A0A559J892_9BACL|nr:DUF6470 family protein [Cohnella terricola]TVX96110.1 hypothetical protein FPZ45_22045 [Cohnella terricola]
MNDLRLSIRQTYASIGIDTQQTTQRMESPRGDLEIEQPKAAMNFSSTKPQLLIDSSEAQHALAKGPHLEWKSYINGQMKQAFLQQLVEKVAEGHRLADITNPANAFAEIAYGRAHQQNYIDYQPAIPGVDNVRLSYDPGRIDTVIEPQRVDLRYTPHKPDIQVDFGKIEIYLKHKNTIDIQVTTYDIYH